MSENPSVNRHLHDKAMDHIDHALGRPIWPLRETYRNHFATGIGQTLALEFEASPYWRRLPANGSMAFYAVTDAGRQALANHLGGLDVDERHRAYVVSYEGQSWIEPAKSRGRARYSAYLKISDVFNEITFADFCRSTTVRAAA